MIRKTAVVFHCLLALFAFRAGGQEFRGSITGQAIDSSGAVIPNVKVTAVNTATNVSSSTVTNETGNYTLPYLMPGVYTVTAEAAGFKKFVREGIAVQVGDRLTLDFRMEVATEQASITVTGEAAPLLNTVTASSGNVLDRRRISELPLPDGNPFILANLAAGVITTSAAMQNQRPFDNGGTSSIRTAGAPGGNEFTLDGAPNTSLPRSSSSLMGSNVAFVPPTEAVEEFKVETASFDAQHGHAPGANINVSLRSGTNTLHGSGYEFYRPERLSANDFLLKRSGRKPEAFMYHRFGGTIGGPVWAPKIYDGRNRTFFFFAYDNIMNDRPGTAYRTVPTLAQREGNFSELLGQGIVIYDPWTARAVSGGRIERSPLPGNIVPAGRISPIARNVLRYYPKPNQPGTAQGQMNFLSDNTSSNRFNSETVRLDHVLTDKHRFFVRAHRNLRDNGGGPGWAGVIEGIKPGKSQFIRRNKGLSYDHLYLMSPTRILNFRLGVSRFEEGNSEVARGFDPASLGFPPAVVALFKGAAFLPHFDLAGYEDIGGGTGNLTAHNILFFQPTYTHIHGRHAMRMGYDARAYRENAWPGGMGAGTYVFDATYTRGPLDNSPSAAIGQDLASMLLGLPSGGRIDRIASRANQTPYQGLFFHDDVKVNSRLTLNLGLRYEVEGATTERFNRNARGFDLTSASPVEAAARAAYAARPDPLGLPVDAFRVRGGLQFADSKHRGFWNTDKNNFQPRAGLAWQLASKTVLRGGWGLYMVPFIIDGVQQAGFSQSTNIVPSLDGGLTFVAGLANPWPSGVVEPLGASGGLATFLGQSITVRPVDRKNGQVQRWMASVQRELPGQWLVEASYSGSRGYELVIPINLNALPRQYLSASPVRDTNVINYLTARVTNPLAGLLPGSSLNSSTIQRAQLLRPFPQFGTIAYERYDGSTSYHGAHVRFERRFSRGFTLNAAYGYSRLRERVSLLNETDTQPEGRISRDNRPHRVAISGIWELPFGRGRRWGSNWHGVLDHILGGWQLGGLYLDQSGRPFSIGNRYFSGDPYKLKTNIGKDKMGVPVFDTSGFYFHDAAVQTNGVDDPAKQRNDPRIRLEYNIRTLPTVLGNFRGDRYMTLDFSMIKTIRITERFKVQLRGESLNTTNRVQFPDFSLDPTRADFGLLGGNDQENVPRQIQLAVKFLF